jgi:hypothetical protein
VGWGHGSSSTVPACKVMSSNPSTARKRLPLCIHDWCPCIITFWKFIRYMDIYSSVLSPGLTKTRNLWKYNLVDLLTATTSNSSPRGSDPLKSMELGGWKEQSQPPSLDHCLPGASEVPHGNKNYLACMTEDPLIMKLAAYPGWSRFNAK